MVVLHHLNNSRSQRLLWLFEELNIPYEIKTYQRDSKTDLAPETIKKVHALGKFPVITDGDITIAESGAIIEYLVEKYGENFSPERGTDAGRSYTYWMHYAEGSLMPLLVIKLIFDKVKSSPMPFFIKPIAKGIANKVMAAYAGPNIKSNLNFINQHLATNEWFCGDQLTGADIQMSFPLEAMVSQQGLDEYPNILAFVKKSQARPAYQKGLKAGGSYDFA